MLFAKINVITAQLFSLNNEKQIATVNKWIGLDNLADSEENRLILESRITFLCSIWHNPIFRPFDTAQIAENYLNLDRKYGFIIRLSSEPGKITISTKLGTVYHNRFIIREDRKIVDSKGNCFDDIEQLASHVATLLSGYSRRCEPVPRL